jgi:mRNA interferase MazF
MNRGEIWWALLGEQGTRPCVIVSPDAMIGDLKTVIVAPLASRGRAVSFRPAVKFDGVDGVLLLDQLRAIDTMQLTRLAGRVDPKMLNKALGTLRAMFAE